jgi:hypothetical protein
MAIHAWVEGHANERRVPEAGIDEEVQVDPPSVVRRIELAELGISSPAGSATPRHKRREGQVTARRTRLPGIGTTPH